ncbi:hypothetical protein [Marilutibacter chinensis]|uniref:Uncharacterized protein n=1 Tax=Marilutibacter chinensis TaxID=2912247 RepID=A0ABS9HW17_9GAMM|nr:hypothetical protein [Lysobacter chinensis]MCF7222582.1 hypothetical protein [Lysobacter chinensis]
MELIELAARPLYLLARLLLWLAWDLLFLTVAWAIGWPIWRVISFGRFPHVGIGEYEESGTGEAFLVCGVGIAILVAMVWLFANHFGWW